MRDSIRDWIPASAGMSGWGAPFVIPDQVRDDTSPASGGKREVAANSESSSPVYGGGVARSETEGVYFPRAVKIDQLHAPSYGACPKTEGGCHAKL